MLGRATINQPWLSPTYSFVTTIITQIWGGMGQQSTNRKASSIYNTERVYCSS